MNVHYSSKTNEWYTPQYLYEYLNKIYDFNLDPCCTEQNRKCEQYFTIEDDGLTKSWGGNNVFVNPPYGREIGKWVEKSLNESKLGATVVMLIPARTDTNYWHNFIFGKASKIIFVKNRIKFGGSESGAPFPSAIVVFKNDGKNEIETMESKEELLWKQ